MINVALCDDDKFFLRELEQNISSYRCSIYTYETAAELMESSISFDIAFLDIELDNGNNGFDLVKHLRFHNKNCIIAFFTNYNQYAIKGYEYQVFRYILKEEPNKLIQKHIKDIFDEYKKRHKTISGSYNGYTFSTSLDEIYYISISNHILTLHTSKGDFEIYKQMKELNSELSELGFVRCHRSYMVNLQHILVMRNDYVFVIDDAKRTTVPIGIRYKNIAETAFLNYV